MWVCRNINPFERDESESFQEAHLRVPSKQSKAISVSALSLESLSHRLVSFVPSLVFSKATQVVLCSLTNRKTILRGPQHLI